MKVNRRRFLQTVGTTASLMATRGTLNAKQPNMKRPNIILCMADDQGWGDMGYNGHPVLDTSSFDALAEQAVRFDRFYAAAPVCSPTRGSVMTGRHPNRFACFSWGHPLRPQEITIAEALKTAGYVTGHFGKWHLGSVRRGSPVNPGASGFDEWLSAENFYDNDPLLSRRGTAVQMQGESSLVTVDAALEFIRQQAGGPSPFLAVIWFGSPHSPHIATEEYRALYEGQDEKLQNFYGEITGVDRAVGKLRRELQALGVHEDTLLWYCSDNGGLPNLGVTGGRGHKGQVYEGGLRVPALLEWPTHLITPRVINVPCHTSDIYPTLLDIAGVQVQNQTPLDGISLLPFIRGEMTTRPQPIGFWHHPTPGIPTPHAQWMQELLEAQAAGHEPDDLERLRLEAGVIREQYPSDTFPGHAAWLDWPWKLHRIQNQGEEVRWELYNLVEDPDEIVNRLTQEPGQVTTMANELEEWLRSVVRSLNGEDYL
ncbi:MAG: sulfatase-like hydrolase/transferase [Candidatus Zipacnadales bacterium]